jgi:hypothetical protein
MRRKDEGLPLVREVLDQQRRADEVGASRPWPIWRTTWRGRLSPRPAGLPRAPRHVGAGLPAQPAEALVELQESFDAERRKHERTC